MDGQQLHIAEQWTATPETISKGQEHLMPEYAHYPSLSDKLVCITGGATGIGAIMVQEFCRQGANVHFVDIAEQEARALCDRIEDKGYPRPHSEILDVTDTDSLQKFIQSLEVQGGIDVLINNVADDQRHSPLEIDQEGWRQCMAVNLDATFFACQAVIPQMKQKRQGSIINLSSINVLIGPKQMPGYVAAKSALNGLSKSLANQYGEYGIRVNTILPGWVATEKQLSMWLTPEAEREWQKSVALRGKLQPIQIANMALFLSADDSEMITGQQFVIDAGRT